MIAPADGLDLLRAGLLDGVSIIVAGATIDGSGAQFAAAVHDTCAGLGARVTDCRLPSAPPADGDGDLARALAGAGDVDMLVIDAAALFAAADPPGSALATCLELSWLITQAVVERVCLPRAGGGRIVYLAPPSSAAAEGADAARAGLENLARTLSIEWARHAITTVTVAPGEGTPPGEIAALTGYLASPAGAYFSGCQLDLRGPRG
jgi:NAD(P)-dependent dehydrogenase (short-subunit alcohol dehydrogenase family)